MSITAERKQALIGEYALKTGDTGSPEVQVAILSERIRNLTDHLGIAQKGFSLAARAVGHGRAAPPPAGLPEARRRRALYQPDRPPRPAPLSRVGASTAHRSGIPRKRGSRAAARSRLALPGQLMRCDTCALPPARSSHMRHIAGERSAAAGRPAAGRRAGSACRAVGLFGRKITECFRYSVRN